MNMVPASTLPSPEKPAVFHGISNLILLLCLAIGLALTTFLYVNFTRVDQERLHERVLRGTQTLAAYSTVAPPTPLLLETIDVMTRIQQELLANPVMNQQVLASYLWKPAAPALEILSLRYMPRVSWNAEAERFEMLDLTGQRQEFTVPILDSYPDGIRPAQRNRDEYYPIQLVANDSVVVDVLGLNHFADPTFHVTLDQARDSGLLTSRTAFPIGDEVELYIITHYYMALYSPGAMPTTIAERRARHTGFVSVTAFTPAAEFIDFLPDSYLGLETVFFLDTDAFSSDNQDAEFKSIMARPELTHEQFQTAGLTSHIIARPSLSLERSMSTPNRWWALSIGLIVTTWVCSILLWLRHNSNILTHLVDERTRDLAERTRTLSAVNSALRQSETRYRMLADNVTDVIFTCDVDGICTYISPSITPQNGFAVEEYLGRHIYAHMPKDSATRIQQFIELAAAKPHTVQANKPIEYQTWCKNGSIRTLECTIAPLHAADGTLTGFLGVSRDITERKISEQEKASLEEVVRQSQKMEAIGTLAGGIAHDFNNLLTGILGHAELLKDKDCTRPELERSVGVIETAAIRAKELTSQLLGFARKGRFQALHVNVNVLLAETIALLERTIGKSVRITTLVYDQNLIVTGEPSQLSQILLNLAVNARDAMPHGGRLLFELDKASLDASFNLARFEAVKPGRYCVISVSDTGIGIARDKLERIFEPFFTDKPDGKGTGLGLAMVYGVAKNHGGTVRVYSEPGKGTVFKVYLPLADIPADQVPMQVLKHPVPGRGRVLVVDDEAIVRNLAEIMLQKLGYSVVCAEDGVQALDYYRSHFQEVDLVIADMIMPNMGGLECLRRMKDINPGLKAILATGFSHETIADKALEGHILGFLQKPFMLQELSELVSTVTQTRPTPGPQEHENLSA